MMFSEPTALRLDREAWAEQDQQDRAEEEAREQRWHVFVTYLRPLLWGSGLASLLRVLADAEDCDGAVRPDTFGWHCAQFAETEGWDGVLSALARALRDVARDAAELERRR